MNAIATTTTSEIPLEDFFLSCQWQERAALAQWFSGPGQSAPEAVRTTVFEAMCEKEDAIFAAKVTTIPALAVKVALLHLWLTDGLLSEVPSLAAAIARDARRIVPAALAEKGASS